MTFGDTFPLYFQRTYSVFYKKSLFVILFAAYIGYFSNCSAFYTSYTIKSKFTWKMCRMLKKWNPQGVRLPDHFAWYCALKNTTLKSTEFLKFCFFNFSFF